MYIKGPIFRDSSFFALDAMGKSKQLSLRPQKKMDLNKFASSLGTIS